MNLNPETERAWLQAGAVLLASFAIGYLFRALVVRRLGAIFRRTKTDLDDLVLSATKRYIPLWVVLGGVVMAARISPLGDRAVVITDRLCTAAFILTVTMAASRIGSGLLARYTTDAGAAVTTTSLTQNVARIGIFGCGILLILSNLGISITPLLTALGVGSLAVALALQPTLSNLFAGIHITLAKPIRVGDFIELESGQQGFVEDIGWRATRIRALPNNLFLVPNARVAEMTVTNYSLPDPEQAALVQVGVSYGSDLAKVERATIEVGREVLKEVEGGVVGFDPFIRYHTFGDSSINFTVILRTKTFTDRFLITHEFIKRLKARYDREGIEIPFPQRVLHGSFPARSDGP